MKKLLSIFALLSGVAFGAPTTPVNNAVMQGTSKFLGPQQGVWTNMPALDVSWSVWGNSYAATGSVSWTFNGGTPPTLNNLVTHFQIYGGVSPWTITFPVAVWSTQLGGTITSITIPASGYSKGTLSYNTVLSRYEIEGDPILMTGSGPLVGQTSANLITPRFANGGFIADNNGNEELAFNTTASAVNQFSMTNAITATNPKLAAEGGDTNIGLDFQAKGTGVYRLLGSATAAGEVRLFEETGNGTNYVPFAAPINLASNVVLTPPAATGTLATLAGAETLSNKTYEGNTITTGTGTLKLNSGTIVGGITGTPTESAGAVTLDCATTSDFAVTLNANLTTVTLSNFVDSQTIVVSLTNTASNYTVTWGNSIKWVGGTQPTQTVGAHTDVWTLKKQGSVIYGSVVQNF